MSGLNTDRIFSAGMCTYTGKHTCTQNMQSIVSQKQSDVLAHLVLPFGSGMCERLGLQLGTVKSSQNFKEGLLVIWIAGADAVRGLWTPRLVFSLPTTEHPPLPRHQWLQGSRFLHSKEQEPQDSHHKPFSSLVNFILASSIDRTLNNTPIN